MLTMEKCPECGSKRIVHLRYYPFLVWYDEGEEKKMPYSRPYIEKAFTCADCGKHFGENI
jgi:DNA-directed RNA polymerase subunit RPC12/RpoP